MNGNGLFSGGLVVGISNTTAGTLVTSGAATVSGALNVGTGATPSSSFQTPPTTGTRNNFTGALGFRFKVSRSVTVSRLGRLYVAGNSQNHAIALWVSTDTVNPIASGTINAGSSSDANNFKWVTVGSVVLSPSSTYVLTVDETNGGDQWRDIWSAASSLKSVFANVESAYNSVQSTYPAVFGSADNSMYSTPAMEIVDQGSVFVVNADGTAAAPSTFGVASTSPWRTFGVTGTFGLSSSLLS